MNRLKIQQAVLVEGKYDKAKLDALVDGLILPVHGFNIFTDKELKELIQKLGEERGLVILTDSDAAGFKIRGYLKGLVPLAQVTDVFIPDIFGKESRKKVPSKEGKVGVEGVSLEVLREAFHNAGVMTGETEKKKAGITKLHLYQHGFYGGDNSGERRQKLYKKLGLPTRMTAKAVLPILNSMMSFEEFVKVSTEIQ